jgi:hypothetical protein
VKTLPIEQVFLFAHAWMVKHNLLIFENQDMVPIQFIQRSLIGLKNICQKTSFDCSEESSCSFMLPLQWMVQVWAGGWLFIIQFILRFQGIDKFFKKFLTRL